MSKIKVLIVDDAVVIRKILTDELSQDPDIEVVGTASNGKIALQKIPLLNPDVVTLDIEMPEMDGLSTLTHIRSTHPKLPVIMFSTLTERGGRDTLEALSRGASDYVTKPANVGNVTNSKEAVRTEMIRKIKQLSRPSLLRPPAPTSHSSPSPKPVSSSPRVTARRIDAVMIGVSTGGPNALATLFSSLPANFPVPILIVQHMPPMFTRLLAERLSTKGKIPVFESKGSETVRPGVALIAPGDYHLEVIQKGADVITNLNQNPPENSCRPAVDPLFRSASRIYKSNLLAVVMTGMGADGMLGAEQIKSEGGLVIAQDEQSSVVWGMPGAVVDRGLADLVLPLDKMADEITRMVLLERGGAFSLQMRR